MKEEIAEKLAKIVYLNELMEKAIPADAEVWHVMAAAEFILAKGIMQHEETAEKKHELCTSLGEDLWELVQTLEKAQKEAGNG